MSTLSIIQPVVIGIDFGGTSVKLGLVQAGGLNQRAESLPTRAHPTVDGLLSAILAAMDDLRGMHPGVVAVGAGLPGIVDSQSGVVRHLANVPGWTNVPLRDLLCMHTGLPVVVENDANATAYAEWKFGAGRGRQNVVCVTLGTGVGGGLILNGCLYRGSRLAAGEIGHMAIGSGGGTLEQALGHRAAAARAAALYKAAGRPRSPADCALATLAAAALQGDEIAQQLWNEFGETLGAALANVVWLLNPEVILLGGGVAQAGDLLLEPVRRTIRERTAAAFHETLEVLPAELGGDAGLIGAGALAVDALGP